MTKKQRLDELKKTLSTLLRGAYYIDARVMLMTFVNGFKILKYRKEATGVKKAWYTLIAIPLLIDGYIRDVRVNSTTGKDLFGEHAKGEKKYLGLSTLTGTLIRVVKAGPKAMNYKLAVQIAEVLNDYDPGHVNLN